MTRRLWPVVALLLCLCVAGNRYAVAASQPASGASTSTPAVAGRAALDPALVAVNLHAQYLPADASIAAPLGGVEIDALVAGSGAAAPVASVITDADGSAELDVPPGVYWVLLPQSAATGQLAGVTMDRLPDGTPVVAWEPIDVSDGNPVAVTLLVQTPGQ